MCQASLRVVISQLQLQLVMPQLLFHSKLGEGHWSNPKPTDKPFKVWLHLHFTFLQMTPSHVEVNRCSGGCFHRQQSCLPTRVKKKKIPVSKNCHKTWSSKNKFLFDFWLTTMYYGKFYLNLYKKVRFYSQYTHVRPQCTTFTQANITGKLTIHFCLS